MNKKILLFSATLGIAYLGFTSYSAGPSTSEGNLTGSGSKAASCGGSGCHAAGSVKTKASLSGLIRLYDKSTGAEQLGGGYTPSKVYTVKLEATNQNLLPKFGFQVSCVKKTTTTPKVMAGTLAVAAVSSTTTAKKSPTGGIDIIEHTKAISAVSFIYTVSFEWTAPAAGSGDVEFYAIVNAVNGTGTSSGDEPSTGLTQVFYEKTASINEVNNNIASKIFPNPCSNMLNIEAASNAKYVATVYDLAGRQVLAASHQSNIDVSSLSAGVYLLRLNTEDAQQTATFIKQ